MKRTLSLLVALALVFTMIPAVFATDIKDSIEMDELVPGMQLNPEPAEIGQEYTTTWDEHYYIITPAEAGKLQFTVENGTIAVQGAADENGYYAVEAGVEYTVVVTKTGDVAPIWSAAVHTHSETYTDNGDGTHDATCSACGEVVVDNEAHKFVDGACVCGAVETPACEYVDADQDGKCDTCGEAKLDETGTLVFRTKAMNLGAEIQGVFQVRITYASSPYKNVKLMIEKVGKTEEEQVLLSATENSKKTYKTYTWTTTVNAKEMADIMKLRLVGITEAGEAFSSDIVTWSIKEGLVNIMAGAVGTAATDERASQTMYLAANMLEYGAEAQNYFKYEQGNLATADLDPAYAAYILKTTPDMEAISKATEPTGTYATLHSISFNLGARVEVLPRFKVPKADSKESYKAEITKVHVAPDGTETTDTFTVQGDKILKGATSTALYVYVDTLASNHMRDVMTITLYKDGSAVSVAQTFSAESAMVSLATNYPDMVRALMNYGDCARAYFG